VVNHYPDGVKERAEYWLNGELVGVRQFEERGELDWEASYRAGVKHGMAYRWGPPGQLTSAEPWENGVPHGTAYQWGEDGRVIGTYTLDHGTGIDLWRQDWPDGSVELAEVHYMLDGRPHGFEWWLNDDQRSVWIERHWADGSRHGVEREWNTRGRLARGYPRYWVRGERVTKRQYLKAASHDLTLPPFRPEENAPERSFPPEIVEHLA
jgi:antitoxin component YwqK of YwqJK toxin-antitoxin module